jgi:hypothetical protein
MAGSSERSKKRNPLFAVIFGGLVIFLDNVGRVQTFRDIFKMIWTNIHLVGPGHLLTWIGAVIAIWGFVALFWPSARTQTVNMPAAVEAPELLPTALPVLKAAPQGRDFVGPNITLPYLSSLFHNKTKIQGRKLCEPLVGKWIRILGKVQNISDQIRLMITLGGPLGNVGCIFDETKWKDRVAMLPLHEKITVIGKIYNIEEGWLWLDECELDD